MRPQLALPFAGELIIDNFAGGGGASTGIEAAFGRPVDVAINHDPEALAMHAANHPHTAHYCESVWDVDPIEVTRNQPVGLVWLSPDCKHFSKAKGGKPVEKKIRGLAWVALRWAATVRPRAIMLENVEEFITWGPPGQDSRPCPARKGKTFTAFVNALKRQGYAVDWRELRACDFGAPTIRKRLFLISRRDGLPIRWPEATHGNPTSEAVRRGKLLPWRTAAECIDWELLCPSIFERTRPLADATCRRIAKGIMRYVVGAAEPFIVKPNHTASYYDCFRGQGINEPLRTISAGGTHFAEVRAFLVKYYGTDQAPNLREPLHTITTKDRFGLVTVHGEDYAIADIGMRMLSPRELYRCQGFPDNYIIGDNPDQGLSLTKTAQVRMVGNSVCPPLSRALVEANFKHEALFMERSA